jgi:ATP-dependent RNA helicase DeaD
VPKPIEALAKRFQKNAIRISANTGTRQHADIDYRAISVASAERENAVINVLRYFEASGALVFCATREGAKHLASRLGNRGFGVVSGELSQHERTRALQAMRDGRAQVCVATDVASRGIDLPNLDLVVHADLPRDSEALLHRSGRTGRAGRAGVSVIITPRSKRRSIEKLLALARIKAAWMPVPGAETILQRDRERLLSDPALEGPLNEEELSFAKELIATKSPEQIAAAFFRQNQARRPTPEEFVDTGGNVSEVEALRSDFDGGVWFKLPVGRKQKAEARWILPLVCKAGGITSRDIGHQNLRNGKFGGGKRGRRSKLQSCPCEIGEARGFDHDYAHERWAKGCTLRASAERRQDRGRIETWFGHGAGKASDHR